MAVQDRQCAGSDGIYQGQHPHRRGYGAFARYTGYYLTGDPTTGYQQLARHLPTDAADTYGLHKRGRLAPGMAADIAIIRPGGLDERATDETPQAQAGGVDLVIVNGTITWQAGRTRPDQYPGQVVS